MNIPDNHLSEEVDQVLVKEVLAVAYSATDFGEACMILITALSELIADRATDEEASVGQLATFSEDAIHNLTVLTQSRYARAECVNKLPA